MSQTQLIDSIHELFHTACKDLFEGLNCQVLASDVPVDRYELDDAPAAFIDGGSDDLEIFIGLRMPLQVLAMTYPVQDDVASIDDAILEDWVAELANRLMGLVKAHLTRRDCMIMIGLPTFYYGADVDYTTMGNGQFVAFYFDLDGVICQCDIAIEIFNPDMQFNAEAPADADDGSIEFF